MNLGPTLPALPGCQVTTLLSEGTRPRAGDEISRDTEGKEVTVTAGCGLRTTGLIFHWGVGILLQMHKDSAWKELRATTGYGCLKRFSRDPRPPGANDTPGARRSCSGRPASSRSDSRHCRRQTRGQTSTQRPASGLADPVIAFASFPMQFIGRPSSSRTNTGHNT